MTYIYMALFLILLFYILHSLNFSKQTMPMHIYAVYVCIIISFFVSFHQLPMQFINTAKSSRDALTFIRLNHQNVLKETAPNSNSKKEYEECYKRIVRNITVYDYPINNCHSYLILRCTAPICYKQVTGFFFFFSKLRDSRKFCDEIRIFFNPLNTELNPICQ